MWCCCIVRWVVLDVLRQLVPSKLWGEFTEQHSVTSRGLGSLVSPLWKPQNPLRVLLCALYELRLLIANSLGTTSETVLEFKWYVTINILSECFRNVRCNWHENLICVVCVSAFMSQGFFLWIILFSYQMTCLLYM